MMELMGNAWAGWQEFTSGTKLAALFLTALIYLWLRDKWKNQKTLFFYTAVLTLCCILPVTAALLMLYQTRFYDYVWIWSLVPVTAVTAWAFTELTEQFRKDFQPVNWKKGLPVTALLLGVLALCSGIGKTAFEPAKEREERSRAWAVMAEIQELQDGELCLWAPREILAYARDFDGSVQLIYGRDMWDASLGAYAYDVYTDELRELYLWMENTDETGQARLKDEEQGEIILSGMDCVEGAMEAGAGCILLPGCLEARTAEELAKAVSAEFSQLGEYYLLTR